MAGIVSAGLGSGLDIDGLVKQLVAAEGRPKLDRIQLSEHKIQAKLSALGQLKSSMDAFNTQISTLTDSLSMQSVSASSSSSSAVSAKASKGATPASYDITVSTLAQAQRLNSQAIPSAATDLGTGQLTFQFGQYDSLSNTFTPNPGEATHTITIDEDHQTLQGIRSAIQAAEIGVQASIVTDPLTQSQYLILAVEHTGAQYGLKITAHGEGLSPFAYDPTLTQTLSVNQLSESTPALNASFSLEGIALQSPINQIDGLINNLSLTLNSTTASGSKVTVSVTQDQGTPLRAVNGLIAGFNECMGTLKKIAFYDRENNQAGVFFGDARVRAIESKLRQTISQPISGLETSDYASLSTLGVKTQSSGLLTLDQAVLNQVLEADSQAVGRLFEGLSKEIKGWMGAFLESQTGLFDQGVNQLNAQKKTWTREREQLSQHMDQVERRYRARFLALDLMVGEMRSLSQYLSQQLGALSRQGAT